MKSTPSRLALVPSLSLLALLAAPNALAGDLAGGLRLGYTHDQHLEQVHAGAQATVARLSPNVHIVPSLECGFGDGTLLALNGDVLYEFTELASQRWSFYAGGGPLLSRFTRSGRSSTDFALSLVVGVTRELRSGRSLLGELRLGLEDAPILKLTAGYIFF